MKNGLPIGDALRFGWEGTKKNFWFLLGLFALFYAVYFGATLFIVLLLADTNQDLASALGSVVNLAANVMLTTGSVAVALKICDGQKPRFEDFLCDGKVLGFSFLWMLLVAPILMIGFLFLIFPGIYLAIRLSQGPYFIVEQRENPIDALRLSWEATQGVAFELFLYYLTAGSLILGGFLLLLVGLIPAWFVTMIASAYLYRVLNQRRITALAPQGADPALERPS